GRCNLYTPRRSKHFVAATLVWALPMPAVKAGQLALDQLDERQLVAACLAGRAGAFDVIVERHRRSVYQLCYRFVGNHEDASDLSQDVFLRAFRGLKSFRGSSSLATLLSPICVNVWPNHVAGKDPITEE